MTKKARALGMSKTIFKNASGLPHRDQVTTARDMATLGRAVQDRFPKLYRYFSTQHFVWRGRGIANHNRMFGRIPGVDGIKTGYTNASGFNLVTSVRHKNRHIVAVVLGGRTGAQRDNHMRELIVDYLDDASAGPRTAPLVVEAPAPVKTAQAKAQPQRIVRVAAPKQQTPLVAGSKDPIRPIMVKTMPLDADGKRQQTAQANLFALSFSNFSAANAVPVPMMPGPVGENLQTAEANALQPPSSALSFASTQQQPVVPAPTAVPAKPQVLAEHPQTPASNAQTPVPNLQLSETEELELEARALAALKNETAPAAVPASAPVPAANNNLRKHRVASTNSIPVTAARAGARSESRSRPRRRPAGRFRSALTRMPNRPKSGLTMAQDTAKALLAKASPYTEKVSKGSTNLFRARFAGFQNEYLARRACQTLQRSQFDCIVAKN